MKMERCKKHPKYTGKKTPTNECVECLNLYFKKHAAPRMPVKATKVIKDKTKFTRKEKHKKKYE